MPARPGPAPLDLLPQVTLEAPRLAACALQAINTPYPHKLDHLLLNDGDNPLPRDIHPVFDGCYDWHSSVHMHWSLLTLCRLAPSLPQAGAIEAHFGDRFTPGLVERERAYAAQAGRGSFERPYGWAWLLKLQQRLEEPPAFEGAPQWADAMRPFARDVAVRFAGFLARSHYAVRAGTHANSAFAMLLAWDYAQACGDAALANAIRHASWAWFGQDAHYPAAYEPSGTDFISPGLCEALLMQRVHPQRFAGWWQGFQPGDAGLAAWLRPAVVSDRLDAQLVHLDGLNLSRAWCLAALAAHAEPALAERFADAATAHWRAAWPHVTGGDFVATHWLVSFALIAALEG